MDITGRYAEETAEVVDLIKIPCTQTLHLVTEGVVGASNNFGTLLECAVTLSDFRFELVVLILGYCHNDVRINKANPEASVGMNKHRTLLKG